MRKFTVEAQTTQSTFLEVEAETPAEALKIAGETDPKDYDSKGLEPEFELISIG